MQRGLSTGAPSRSACSSSSRSFRAAPPSTRSSLSAMPLPLSMARMASTVWKAIASSAARARWALLLPRVRPAITPRA
ncbi:MAG: hypothetical protein A2075_14125 [Geobacteraceae bacterium GWC2_58_44]|nr:MAG: hypothetical protein A2075_14125 [Geobacteraceae bacterium GWC2_58_44]